MWHGEAKSLWPSVLDGMDLTDAQWAILAPLLPKPRLRRDRRGRPWRDPRDVLNGILWILRTGAPWKDLPDRYPSYQTCHRRFQRWVRAGTLRARPASARRRSPRPRRSRPQRDVHRRLLCERQKKGRCVGKTKRGKGTKIMAIADRAGLPVAVTIASASPHETHARRANPERQLPPRQSGASDRRRRL